MWHTAGDPDATVCRFAGYLEGAELDDLACRVFNGGEEMPVEARQKGAAKLLRQLDEVDGDGDGKVSFSEFEWYFTKNMAQTAFELKVEGEERKRNAPDAALGSESAVLCTVVAIENYLAAQPDELTLNRSGPSRGG